MLLLRFIFPVSVKLSKQSFLIMLSRNFKLPSCSHVSTMIFFSTSVRKLGLVNNPSAHLCRILNFSWKYPPMVCSKHHLVKFYLSIKLGVKSWILQPFPSGVLSICASDHTSSCLRNSRNTLLFYNSHSVFCMPHISVNWCLYWRDGNLISIVARLRYLSWEDCSKSINSPIFE